ncbi:hypothetical protein HDA37_002082 [Pseudonocardia antarctica]|uniref:Uncharacterized protein n=1 Tax=Pseudonocardia alni TaxID=33907 RepID=A0A852VZ12_PSEA5|nr:hypothetical protein [Pseudonocardia antarctica]
MSCRRFALLTDTQQRRSAPLAGSSGASWGQERTRSPSSTRSSAARAAPRSPALPGPVVLPPPRRGSDPPVGGSAPAPGRWHRAAPGRRRLRVSLPMGRAGLREPHGVLVHGARQQSGQRLDRLRTGAPRSPGSAGASTRCRPDDSASSSRRRAPAQQAGPVDEHDPRRRRLRAAPRNTRHPATSRPHGSGDRLPASTTRSATRSATAPGPRRTAPRCRRTDGRASPSSPRPRRRRSAARPRRTRCGRTGTPPRPAAPTGSARAVRTERHAPSPIDVPKVRH